MVLSKEKVITEIVLSGGGTNALALIGALHTLHTERKTATVTRWVGASAGALIALFMVLGYAPQSVYRLLLNIDYEQLNEANCDSVLSFYDTMGVIDGYNIMNIMRLAMRKKGYDVQTNFIDLQNTSHCDLVVAVYNLTTGKTVSFSAQTTPHVPVLTACRMSISVPFLFRPVQYKGDMYIDGCTIEHVPVRFSKHKDKAIIIQCVTATQDSNRAPIPHDVPSFFSLLHRRIGTIMHKKCLRKVMKKRPHTILNIVLPCTGTATFVVDFGMNTQHKKNLFLLGTESAHTYINTVWKKSLSN